MPSTEGPAQRLAPGRAGVQGAEPPGFSAFLYVVHCALEPKWPQKLVAPKIGQKWPQKKSRRRAPVSSPQLGTSEAALRVGGAKCLVDRHE